MTTAEVVETVEIFEDVYANKQTLVEHLATEHREYAHSKLPKGDLIDKHERYHAARDLDKADWQQRFKAEYDHSRSAYVIKAHDHVLVAAEDLKNYRVPNLDKPLSTQEAAALKAVIEADFDALEQNIRSMAQQEKEARRAEVEEVWKKRAEKPVFYQDKRNKLYDSFRQSLTELRDKAVTDGITLDIAFTASNSAATLTGKSEAVNAVVREVDSALQLALTTAKRQRAAALRTVALARITPEARKVLDGIPDAQTLMLEAAKEQAAISS